MVGDKSIRFTGGEYREHAKFWKRKLSLVLDAARTPSHTFQQVLDAFRALHREESQKAGFAQVWAVGPQDSLVERLDW